MNLDLSWGSLARAAGGRLLSGNAEDRVNTIGTDTRRLIPGSAFWALAGNRYDAHDFLDKALGGVAGWVVEAGKLKASAPRPAHVVEVPNTLKALQALASWHRGRFSIPIAAVAGSNGKTSTKEILRSICAVRGPVCATEGNLNNQYGLPLSLLELGPLHRFGVFELGESHPGDLEELTRILQPTVGVLTNVGPAHLEFFGSLEGVYRCLCELIEASPASTRFAVNLDDPWLSRLEAELGPRAVGYGASPKAQLRLLPSTGTDVELQIAGRRLRAKLPSAGALHRLNAAAAAAAATAMGLGPEEIAQGLASYRPAPMRFEEREHASGARLVLDAYNANPGSMRAGIEAFLEAHPAGRRILVLGDMKELGAHSAHLHRELGEWIGGLKVEAVFLAGPEMRAAALALSAASSKLVRFAERPQDWLGELAGLLDARSAAYFKASRAMAFEKLLKEL